MNPRAHQNLQQTQDGSGLQFADMIARPIGLSVLRPEQPNRAWEIIKRKMVATENGESVVDRMKVFPLKAESPRKPEA